MPQAQNDSLPDQEKFPLEIYNMILFKCFDACIINFENKTLDNSEQHCVDECALNLKEGPLAYRRSQ